MAALQSPASTDDDVVQAARSDVLAQRRDDREEPVAFGRFLAGAVSDPRNRLEPDRGAALLQRFNAQTEALATFWSEFSTAALQQLAGEDLQVAETHRSALRRGAAEGIPAAIVTRTAGIMANAQQVGGLSHEAGARFSGCAKTRWSVSTPSCTWASWRSRMEASAPRWRSGSRARRV